MQSDEIFKTTFANCLRLSYRWRNSFVCRFYQKDLGVTLDPRLTFIEHITNIVNRSLKMLGFVKRNSGEFSNFHTLKILYCSLVRTHLEYASSVWNPHYTNHINMIERVQRKFLHYINYKIFNNEEFHYDALCQRLNLQPLSLRRRHSDLRLFFKVTNSLIDCPTLVSEVGFHAPTRTTRNRQLFNIPSHRTNYGANSFISRTSSLANQHDHLDFFGTYRHFLLQLSHLP